MWQIHRCCVCFSKFCISFTPVDMLLLAPRLCYWRPSDYVTLGPGQCYCWPLGFYCRPQGYVTVGPRATLLQLLAYFTVDLCAMLLYACVLH